MGEESVPRLPRYEPPHEPAQSPAQSTAGSRDMTNTLRGTDIIQVDVIRQRPGWSRPADKDARSEWVELQIQIASFLMTSRTDYPDMIYSIRSMLNTSYRINWDRYDLCGIRMAGNGPQIGESEWSVLSSRVDRIEAILSLSQSARDEEWEADQQSGGGCLVILAVIVLFFIFICVWCFK